MISSPQLLKFFMEPSSNLDVFQIQSKSLIGIFNKLLIHVSHSHAST